MNSLQELIDQQAPGSVLRLTSGEYEGPIFISQPITVIGKGVTIWANRGPVITISSGNVVLQDVNIELSTKSPAEYVDTSVALKVEQKSGVELRNIELRGSVEGFQDEEGIFLLPDILNLGDINVSTAYTASFVVHVPVNCSFFSNIDGLTLTTDLNQGSLVRCTVQLIPFDYRVSLYGYITLCTSRVRRKIVVVGNVVIATGNMNNVVTPDTTLWNACDMPIYATLVAPITIANAKAVCDVTSPPIIADPVNLVSKFAVQPACSVSSKQRFVKQPMRVDESVFSLGVGKQDDLAVQTSAPVRNAMDVLGTVFQLDQQVDNHPPDSHDWSSRPSSSKSSIVKESPNLLPDIFGKND